MRLIDADALADNLEKQSEHVKSNALLLRIIASGLRYDEAFAPTIDPASLRPKGEWKVYLGGKELMCTACQATFWDEDGNGGSNFCPNCGAKMDLEG